MCVLALTIVHACFPFFCRSNSTITSCQANPYAAVQLLGFDPLRSTFGISLFKTCPGKIKERAPNQVQESLREELRKYVKDTNRPDRGSPRKKDSLTTPCDESFDFSAKVISRCLRRR